jgi:hypothetical protein
MEHEHYTIPEAADATGLSPRDVRSLVEDGQLEAVARDGIRLIPHAALARAGLLEDGEVIAPGAHEPEGGPGRGDAIDLEAALKRAGGEPAEPREPEGQYLDAASAFAELLQRIESQAGELSSLKALVAEAESLCYEERARLEAGLHEARAEAHSAKAEVAELEARLEAPRRPRLVRPALTALFEETGGDRLRPKSPS